jgi:signal transduction histidine kinase
MIEQTHRAGAESACLDRQSKTLRKRAAQLSKANGHLKQGILQRKSMEDALRKSGQHYAKLLRKAHQLQEQLRQLTHRLLSAQEVERGQLSHKLHDGVGQTLLGVNVHLLSLKKAAQSRSVNLTKEIASTQRVVEESVRSINRFAQELAIQQSA